MGANEFNMDYVTNRINFTSK